MNEREKLQAILRELGGTTCACGASKARRQTFCRGDYFRLPGGLRARLYSPVGEGYAEAYQEACTRLGLISCTEVSAHD